MPNRIGAPRLLTPPGEGSDAVVVMRPHWAILLVGAGLSLAGTAAADEAPTDPEKIRAAADEFDAGLRAYKGRSFEEAAAHFENANLAAPNPEALRSAIKARAEAKQPGRAATLAALALARYPDNGELVAYARSVVADDEQGLGKLQVQCTPACSLAIDERVVPIPSATDATVYVEPGNHTIVAGWSSGRTRANDVGAVAGATSEVSFSAPPVPDADTKSASTATGNAGAMPSDGAEAGLDAEGRERAGWSPIYFYVGAGATAVLAGATIFSGLDAKSNPGPDAVRARCAGQGESCPLYQDGIAKQTRTNVLLGATGLVGVATAIVGAFATDWTHAGATTETTKGGARLSPVVRVADGAFFGAVGSF